LITQFIIATANLIAFNLGIPQNRDISVVTQIATHSNVPEYKPRKIKVELPGQEGQQREEAKEEAAPEDE